ncbi:CPBP family intramembrane glutamic endopeptidase [Halalkalicoccus subterraneus]|uniref:CPBP family intramembrane glutamic endopeptidase n=1 Tax=Halalkalicoccus subterraneus TaxID=2675002 RepID=UPI0013CE5F13|nr:CPBP family intramembrane glutamic endopeptidase [Halalkalicoccus subterraneus]
MNDTRGKRRPLLLVLLGVGLWTSVEVITRRILVSRIRKFDEDLTGDMLVSLATIPLLGWVIARIGNQMGFEQEYRGYQWTPRAIGGGIIAGVAGLASLSITTQIDRLLFGSIENTEIVTQDTSTTAASLLVVVNGIIVPIVEEFVWRGIIQTAFVERFGTTTGIVLTSLSFSLKHAIVDRSLNRITMLFGLGSIFGLVRHRLGTCASTAAHITGNLPASLIAIVVKQLE